MSKKYKPSRVNCEKYKPLALELIKRCGSPEKASEYSGIGTSTFYRIRQDYHCSINRETAAKLVYSLMQKRKEDRVNGNPIHAEVIKQQAKRDERITRLAGY